MSETLTLKIKSRKNKNKQTNKLRQVGKIPAVLYGAGKEPISVIVNFHDFTKVYEQAGESSIIDLELDNEPAIKALIKDTQKHPLQDTIRHADFYRVDMNKPIEVEIPLIFNGEANAEKKLGGTLVKNYDSLPVRCLPGDLVEKIDIDISGLETFTDRIRIKDLKLPEKIEILPEMEETIAHVLEPRVEAEPVAEEEAGEEGAEVKKGEEAKEEGEAAPEAEAKDGEKKEDKSAADKK